MLAGDSNRAKKSYNKYALTSRVVLFNMSVVKRAKIRQVHIMRIEDNKEGISYSHEDALVIKAGAMDKEINKILVDSGSLVDIFFKFTIDEMGIINVRLEHMNTLLKGFGRGKLIPLRVIEFSVIGSRFFLRKT